ncbi:tyrosine-type recombinase/integrase [Burkholderia dolosa]|uniref:phage integrase n=1 Tax=Burkholderia dolosa TaxID=152500 RepID=UPI001BA3EF9A|nr:tyrosine-type recombinase/integrase [Burkholderia dolosa]
MQTTFGILRVTLRYSYARGGTIYFQRAVPDDLRDRYPAKLIKINLGTGDVRVAARKIEQLNRELEAEWTLLRGSPEATPKTIKGQAEELLKQWGLSPAPAPNDPDARDIFYGHLDAKRERYAAGDEHLYRENPADEYLSPAEIKAAQLLAGSIKPTLSDALELYLKVHPKRTDEKFVTYTRRAFSTLTTAIGDKAIEELSREDAHTYVTKEHERGNKTGTIRRRLNVVKAVIETYLREKEIDRKNPFASVPIPTEGNDEKKRQPFTQDELTALFAACKEKDDDVRWLVAILGDTGARLAEIAGLALDDIVIDGAETPHVVIKPRPWRSLKNTSSERVVPLLGHALWAAQRVREKATKGQRFAFPRYTSTEGTKADIASATIAKWIRAMKIEHTAHELRHTMADRLREVQCPEDIRFAIGGWASKGIGAKYGKGYSLRVMAEWLGKVVI